MLNADENVFSSASKLYKVKPVVSFFKQQLPCTHVSVAIYGA